MPIRTRVLVPPVEIVACEIASIISVDDAVGIEHGDEPEVELLAEHLRVLRRSREKVDDAPHDPAGVAFPRMHSRRHEDDGAIHIGSWITRVRDAENLARVPCDCLAKVSSSEKLLSRPISFPAVKVLEQVCVRVGVAVSDVTAVKVIHVFASLK
eukprot:766328-Hanusia_phi.AAC.12